MITNVTGPRIRRVLQENIDFTTSTLHTDAAPVYETVGKQMVAHHIVNHRAGQYVTEFSDGTNKAENFISQLKRSIDGTHHSVSKEHLNRYLVEFAFRHGSHMLSDTERMVKLMSQTQGLRLSYRPLTEDS